MTRVMAVPSGVSGVWRAFSAAITLCGLVTMLGCSGTDAASPTNTGATGGNPAGGSAGMLGSGGTAGNVGGAGRGGTLTSGGAGGSLPSGSGSLTEICVQYVTAHLARLAQCANAPDSLTEDLGQTLDCPDLLFADGSTRTAAGMLACADAWRTFPCESVQKGLGPSCRTAGMRPAGAACLYPAQCASLSCPGNVGSCGTCDRLAKVGESCATAGVACEIGTQCQNGICAALGPPSPPPLPPVLKAAGEVCLIYADCQNDLYCADDGQGAQRCAPLPHPGNPCTSVGDYCASDAWCDREAHLCKVLPSAGQACGVDFGPTDPRYCAAGLMCDAENPAKAICRPAPQRGEHCSDFTLPCASDANCLCEDAACATKRCLSILLSGAVCPVVNGVCHPGTRCQSGFCKPISSQGLFEAACNGP